MRSIHLVLRGLLLAVAGAILFAMAPAIAEDAGGPDKVKVGVFPISSSLPYFVARDLGYFKDLNLDPETSVLMGGPPNVAALITNQIEVSAVLVTLEGLNADVKKPGVAMYVATADSERARSESAPGAKSTPNTRTITIGASPYMIAPRPAEHTKSPRRTRPASCHMRSTSVAWNLESIGVSTQLMSGMRKSSRPAVIAAAE